MAEPPSIFAIFTGYDLDIKYLLKATFIRYCYKQHNTDALKINEYFQPKIRNTGIYIPIIQDNTFNQSEIYLQHHEQNAGQKRDTDQIQHLEKKTVIPYICRSIFQTNYPIADYYKFYKNTNPLQVISKKNQTKIPILGSNPLLNLQDLPFFFKARIRYNGDLQITTIHNHLIQKIYLS